MLTKGGSAAPRGVVNVAFTMQPIVHQWGRVAVLFAQEGALQAPDRTRRAMVNRAFSISREWARRSGAKSLNSPAKIPLSDQP